MILTPGGGGGEWPPGGFKNRCSALGGLLGAPPKAYITFKSHHWIVMYCFGASWTDFGGIVEGFCMDFGRILAVSGLLAGGFGPSGGGPGLLSRPRPGGMRGAIKEASIIRRGTQQQ